jgi:hypothetical protein
MPYQAGKRLPAERASKLGHLDVLKSPLVQQLVQKFEEPDITELPPFTGWQAFPQLKKSLDTVFAVDGSWQPITDERPPYKSIAFIKTALVNLDQVGLSQIDSETPHPFAIRDLMAKSAAYHATALPLRHVYTDGISVYNAVRQAIYESVKDESLQGEVMVTLKWLAYEKWSNNPRPLPPFECPHCESKNATLPIDAEKGNCPNCGNEIFITDMLGFHLEMVEDAASDSVATAYMIIHETLLLFTGIRHFWETAKDVLSRCLFIKDGPLQIRAQYSKLVNPIRNFLLHANDQGYPVSLIGQEKTGTFVDHLNLIGRNAPAGKLFVPDHTYICEQIQHRPPNGAPYGRDTNYGAKVFVIPNERCRLVLNVPVKTSMGAFIANPSIDQLINIENILATLPTLLSSRHENALLPIELANSVASLSTYPSAQVLRLFTEAAIKKL